MKLFQSASTAVLLSAALQVSAQGWQVGQKVDTTSGTIVGHASEWKSAVSEYLGVPYAQPPVGSLRFTAPKALVGKDTIVAGNFSPSCPSTIKPVTGPALANLPPFAETLISILGQKGDTFDEDCLTLNVWTKPQTGEANKTVMVWIYGGGFTSGNSDSPAYNGARLADENDVVVVSINYRVGIFGFPGVSVAPERNPGLLDQRLGLEWVRDNIHKFGGDPAKITLFGQSAGGASTDYHTFAWPQDPIARAFIPESGAASNLLGGTPNNTAAWNNATAKLGCPDEASGSASLTCMRSKSFQDIITAITPTGAGVASAVGGFLPTVDNKVIFEDYDALRAKGQFAKKPMLVGNANNELGLFILIACVASNKTDCKSSLPPLDLGFNCLSGDSAKARVDHGVKAWRYEYAATWQNQDIGVTGAWHGSEIALVFGTTERFPQEDSPAEKVFSKYLRKVWTTFAKDPEHGLSKLGLPVYNPYAPTIIKLGGTHSGIISFESPLVTDAICPLIKNIDLGGLISGGGLGGLGGLGSLTQG